MKHKNKNRDKTQGRLRQTLSKRAEGREANPSKRREAAENNIHTELHAMSHIISVSTVQTVGHQRVKANKTTN